MPKTLQLIVLFGANVGEKFLITERGATLGRSKTCDICINDTLLSRQHCRISLLPKPTLQDLCSSNGTLLNDVPVTDETHALSDGDRIKIGTHILGVSIPNEATAKPLTDNTPSADLFVADKTPTPPVEQPATPKEIPPIGHDIFNQTTEQPQTGDKKNSFIKRFLLWLASLIFLFVGGGLIYVMSLGTSSDTGTTSPTAVKQLSAPRQQAEFIYERLVIDAQHLFRYHLSYDFTTNILALDVDDLGDRDRSFSKRSELAPDVKTALVKLLIDADLSDIREIFPERSHDGITLKRRSLTIVRGMEIWERVAENVPHVAFDELCEQLEFFARDEFQIWAAQYSVAELEALAHEQLEIADRYWEQRDLGEDKLWLAFTSYSKGLSALETLNPKPNTFAPLTAGLKQADALLKERYEATIFEVEQAINTRRYDVAIAQLQKILRMIPDRNDTRNRQATKKLLSVEQRRKNNK